MCNQRAMRVYRNTCDAHYNTSLWACVALVSLQPIENRSCPRAIDTTDPDRNILQQQKVLLLQPASGRRSQSMHPISEIFIGAKTAELAGKIQTDCIAEIP